MVHLWVERLCVERLATLVIYGCKYASDIIALLFSSQLNNRK